MSDHSYAGARLLLDYLKAFTWPLVILIVLLFYRGEIKAFINEREFSVAGLIEVGPRIDEIRENADQELADIRALLDQILAEDTSSEEKNRLAEVTLTKVDSFQMNINKATDQVQQAAQPSTANTTDPGRAKALEEAGFQAITKRDYVTAQRSFAAAYRLYPDYHNVDEINRLLQEYQARLQSPDSPAWKLVEEQIITNYSWGLPKDLRGDYRQVISPKQ